MKTLVPVHGVGALPPLPPAIPSDCVPHDCVPKVAIRPTVQLTPEQYAARLGIGPHAVRKQIRKGTLPPGVRVIRHSRFYLLEVAIE